MDRVLRNCESQLFSLSFWPDIYHFLFLARVTVCAGQSNKELRLFGEVLFLRRMRYQIVTVSAIYM